VHLSETGYAKFCRRFGSAVTDHLLDDPKTFPPARTAIVVNDISESPELARLDEAGFPILSIWHVDVVEFFNRMYMKNVFSAPFWTRLYTGFENAGLSGLVPDMLKLVFAKQQDSVTRSNLLVVPSSPMKDTITDCYEHLESRQDVTLKDRIRVIPWGGWDDGGPDEEAAVAASRLRAHYQIRDQTRVILTLSRISPEKGLHILLDALKRLERSGRLRGEDVCLFVCGEPAFMRGDAYMKRVRRAAAQLSRVRVFFPGYLAPPEKKAYFKMADLFVSPSVHESYGLTVVEAVRAGLPVLASDHHGVSEILRPEYGSVVSYREPMGRARALAEGLGSLLGDSARLEKMGRRARSAGEEMDFGGSAHRLLDAALGMLEQRAG